MEPSTIRICHLCGGVEQISKFFQIPNLFLRHLIGEYQQTRQTMAYLFSSSFGDALVNELTSGSTHDLLVKLLETTFIIDLNLDDMTYLRAEFCFNFLNI